MSVFDEIVSMWRKQGYSEFAIHIMLTAWPESPQMNELDEIVDQDELQQKDEMNQEWVEAWKKEVRRINNRWL